MLRLRCLECRHHLFGKEFQAFAKFIHDCFTRLVQQDDLVDMQCRILAQVVADRLRRAKQTARDSPRVTFRILRLPFLVFGTKFECPGRRSVAVFAEPTRGIVFQRELEERHTIGASSRFLIRLRTHEIADQGHILIGRQLNDPVAEAGILRRLAGRDEENFGRRAMRILL